MTKILLAGGTGQIGWELQHTLPAAGEVIAPARDRMDLANPDSIRSAIRAATPEVIVNAAAFTSMDQAEAQPALAMQVNGVAPGIIAEEAKRLNALLVHYSSAYVFDGGSARPYVEDDPPGPINAYGRTKLAGERAIAAAGCAYIIFRLSWIHSLRGTNFLTAILRLAGEKTELPVVDDQIGSPTWARSVAHATQRVLKKWRPAGGQTGIFHLSASGMVSRSGFANEIIEAGRRTGLGAGARARVQPVASADYPLPALRPKYCVLDNAGIRRAYAIEMPHWKDEVVACMADTAA
jgi:dTDP-4-dehydrorhamnose reductase